MNSLLTQAVLDAMQFYEANGYELPDDLILKRIELKFRAGQSLAQIEDEYATVLYDIMDEYANTDRPVTAFRNRYNRAANDAMNGAVRVGWVDGGASGGIPGELQDWVNKRINQEVGFIVDMFKDLKELRKLNDADQLANFIQARAQGYTASLEGVYLEGKAYALGKRPGRWEFGATEIHCRTCQGLAGEIHPVSWYVDRGLIPRQPGNRKLECGGWRCDCRVVDPETGEQLL